MDKNSLLIELSESGRFWQVEFEELSPPEQVFRAIWDLEADVNNGGFQQYYGNSSGDTAFFVIEALKTIGANAAADIVSRAHTVFPGSAPPRDRDEREDLTDSLPEEKLDLLSGLDDEFYKYPDNLTELLFAFVQANASQIQGADKVPT